MDSSSSEQRSPRRHGDNSLPAIHQPSSQLTDPLPSSELEDPYAEAEHEDPYAEAEHEERPVEVIDNIVDETRDLWATLRNRSRRQYNIATFLKSWCSDRGYKSALLADALADKDVREALKQRGVTITLASDNTIFDTRQLRKEMRTLSQNPGFGEFKPYDDTKETANKISEVSSTQWLDSTLSGAWPTMQSNAPRLVAFLSQMLVNQQKTVEIVESTSASNHQSDAIYLLTSLFLRGYARNKTPFLREVLGLYMLANGTPRRVIDTLASLGVISSYTHLNGLLNDMQINAKAKLKQVAHDPTGVVVYDNFNFLNRIQELAGGRQNQFVNLTTACLVSCPEIDGPLLQSSINRAQRFTMKMVRESMIRQPQTRDIASRLLVKFSIGKLLGVEKKNLPKWPEVKQVHYEESPFLQIGAIWEDEGTIQGVYNIHEELWKQRLNFKEYDHRLTLVYGDQKTTSFIRRVQQDQVEASEQWEQRRWMLPVPAFFHIEMNFMEMLFRTFWDTGDANVRSTATISSDVVFFRREKAITKKDMKYHQAMPLLIHGFTSRIVAFLIADLVDSGVLERGGGMTVNAIEEAMKDMDQGRLENVLNTVWETIFSHQGWSGLYDGIKDEDHVDKEFRSHCRLMQCVEMLLLIHEAVRNGDYGLLADLIPQLPVLFWGGKSSNYGPEMMYFAWLLHPKVTSDAKTRDAILKGGLVRCTTAGSSYKAIDLMLEHINCAFAKDIKYNKNSTHDIHTTFSRLALNGNYLATIRKSIERVFHSKQKGTHTSGDATADIISYAHKLYEDGFTVRRPNNGFDVPDIVLRGQDILVEKLPTFNEVVPFPIDAADQRMVPGVGEGGVVDGQIDWGEEGDRLYDIDNEGDGFFEMSFGDAFE
jgi:hypothetical protein